MERIFKPVSKKISFSNHPKERKTAGHFYSQEEPALRKIIQHLFHPDYILFDWEFYSNALEFE